jgi:hypothetical protein
MTLLLTMAAFIDHWNNRFDLGLFILLTILPGILYFIDYLRQVYTKF